MPRPHGHLGWLCLTFFASWIAVLTSLIAGSHRMNTQMHVHAPHPRRSGTLSGTLRPAKEPTKAVRH